MKHGLVGVLVVITVSFVLIACPNAGVDGGSGDGSADPPDAPAIGSAVPEVGRATITFTQVPGVTSYRIYYRLNSGVTTGDSFVSVTGSPSTITGLNGATTYAFAVTAVDGALESTLSGETTAITLGAANETDLSQEFDYTILQSPASTTDAAATIYGRVYEPGITDAAGDSGLITAELGYGPSGTNPLTDTGWTYIPATFVLQYGNDDEYGADLPGLPSGSYAYTFRFTQDNLWYTYTDTDGAGSNPTFDFSSSSLGLLTAP